MIISMHTNCDPPQCWTVIAKYVDFPCLATPAHLTARDSPKQLRLTLQHLKLDMEKQRFRRKTKEDDTYARGKRFSQKKFNTSQYLLKVGPERMHHTKSSTAILQNSIGVLFSSSSQHTIFHEVYQETAGAIPDIFLCVQNLLQIFLCV